MESYLRLSAKVSAVATETQLRRDAAANRERILETARRLFADQGLETSMDEIARSAGVGPATLYRRFPTKEALLDAVLGDVLERFHGFAQEALENDDAFAGLELLLARATRLQSENRGLLDILLLRLPQEPQLAKARARFWPLVEQLVERAQQQGALRTDLAPTDITVLLWQLGRVVDTTTAYAPELWRRYLALALDGLRPQAARPLPHAPLTRREIDKAMTATAKRRGHHLAEHPTSVPTASAVSTVPSRHQEQEGDKDDREGDPGSDS
jgi:AcrR family transcriptional regulator